MEHRQELCSLVLLTYEVSFLEFFLKWNSFHVNDVVVLYRQLVDGEEVMTKNCRVKKKGVYSVFSKTNSDNTKEQSRKFQQ